MLDRNLSRRAAAAQEFHRARRQAALESLVARVSGQSADLLSFDDVVDKLGLRSQSEAGLQQVPISAIIGSVGRYRDFSRTFLPRTEEDQDRWVGVSTAAAHVGDLPPVQLYRLSDRYFVLDGNHRISIARTRGLDYIDAHVIDVQTRVPLPPGAAPDALIIAAEYASFLRYTGLDRVRPDLDLTVSVPGQYVHLENHVEAQRYLSEAAADCEFTIEEAAAIWYDRVYWPLIEAIRERGILRYFPGRTETDFFVWLARHRAALRSELGIDVTPDETVTHLLDRVALPPAPEPASRTARLQHRLRRLVVPDAPAPSPPESWSERRALDRYSDRLFASILLATPASTEQQSLETRNSFRQALSLAQAEQARLHLVSISDQATGSTTGVPALSPEQTAPAGDLDIELVSTIQSNQALAGLARLAVVHDLVVIDRALIGGAPADEASVWLTGLVAACARPVLITGSSGSTIQTDRIFLRLINEPQAREALFLAAYLAESWGATLVVHPTAEAAERAQTVATLPDYLEMHELPYELLPPGRRLDQGPAELAREIAAQGCGLGVLVGPHDPREAAWIETLCHELTVPVLLTT